MLMWLADVLRTTGHPVVEHPGWQTRGRPGAFAPRGVLIHHTAFKASVADPFPAEETLLQGRPGLTGPLCQVAPDYLGRLHVIAAGRANHAGLARQVGPMPAGDGNELYVGFELDYSGYQAPSPLQLLAASDATRAVLARLKRDATYCRGHRETSTTGKWDPGQVDMADFRAAVARPPTRPTPPGDDMTPEQEALLVRAITLITGVGHGVVDDGESVLSVARDIRAEMAKVKPAVGRLEFAAAALLAGGGADVDEQALAAALAPLLDGVVRTISDTDLAGIADAVADETARRQEA